jgi:hypothetical protein
MQGLDEPVLIELGGPGFGLSSSVRALCRIGRGLIFLQQPDDGALEPCGALFVQLAPNSTMNDAATAVSR